MTAQDIICETGGVIGEYLSQAAGGANCTIKVHVDLDVKHP